jgi:hypothetical protein
MTAINHEARENTNSQIISAVINGVTNKHGSERMTDQEPPKRKGRPPKYAGEGKRQNFSFRIRDKVREQLIAAVQETGRSLSEEIEHRLERSFEENDRLDYLKNEAVWRQMAVIKANKGQRINLDLTIALMDSISQAEREVRGGNTQAHDTDLRQYVTAEYEATRDPSIAPPDPVSEQPLDGAVIEEAVVRALKRVLPPTLTNRDKLAEQPEPPTVAPVASPTEPDEPAQDGQPAKGGRKKPSAE